MLLKILNLRNECYWLHKPKLQIEIINIQSIQSKILKCDIMPEFGIGGGSATDIPLSKIQELKSRGMTNNQIIQTLQQQGFTMTQVFDALSQSSVQPSATTQAMQNGTGQFLNAASQTSQVPPLSPSQLNTRQTGVRRMEMPPMPNQQAPLNFDPGSDTEEMIEAIIDEKWNDMVADINKVIAWKESTESRIAKMEQQMVDMKDQFDKLHQAIVGKVGEYDQHILEVGAEVKAMEKVFSKVLPVFTDNVAELSRITDQVRRQNGAAVPPTRRV